MRLGTNDMSVVPNNCSLKHFVADAPYAARTDREVGHKRLISQAHGRHWLHDRHHAIDPSPRPTSGPKRWNGSPGGSGGSVSSAELRETLCAPSTMHRRRPTPT